METHLRLGVSLLLSMTEAAAALIIFSGVLFSFVRLVCQTIRRRATDQFVEVRLGLGRILALGLEFQLASDLLRTAVSPTFEEIGKLAAVATIRTALNFFLSREIKAEREEAHGASPPAG